MTKETITITVESLEEKLSYIAWLESQLIKHTEHKRCYGCELVFSEDEIHMSEDSEFRCDECDAEFERESRDYWESLESDYQRAKRG